MKVSLNWLQRYLDLPESPQEIADSLTLLGFEVDDIETTGVPPLEHVIVGEVLEREQHPNADRLGVCRVALGDSVGEKSIVCGATNYKVGDRVPVALPGATLPGGFTIKRSKLRGVESDGMMCSGKEIGASDDAAGLLILSGEPELGTPINYVLTASDTVFNLEVTPNRPDCLSHIGIARELAAWYRRELAIPEVEPYASIGSKVTVEDRFANVEVECPDDCPLYLATVVKGLKIGPSPVWMQDLLQSIGLRPINNVVDVTNFVLHECGNPMHAFDARDIAGGRIIVRNAQDGEKITTLDGEERLLSSRMPVIADPERALAVAGVMGGQNSEVKEDTTDLVLEVACFNPRTIRWVSKTLGLSSDSSYRFERGIDIHSLEYARDRAIQLILETAGGELCEPSYSAGKAEPSQRSVSISTDWVRSRSGFEISDAEIEDSLQALGLNIASKSGEDWEVDIPSFRGDLERPIDLLEEILRIYGTHRIPTASVVATASAETDHPITEFVRRASSYLVGQDFSEAVNYTLRSNEDQSDWLADGQGAGLSLKNPISEDQTELRFSLLEGLMDTVRLNQSRKTGATRFFETGRVFREVGGKIVELISVAFVESGENAFRSWVEPQSDDFYKAKNRVATIAGFSGFDMSRFRIGVISDDNSVWQGGHAAIISEGKAGLFATMGMLDLKRTRGKDIDGILVAGEFCVLPERLKSPKRPKFQAFSLFPPSSKDLSVLADQAEQAASISAAISKFAAKATKGAFEVERAEVFDVYEGEGIPEGKKSVAVSIAFRSKDRTLKDKEVNAAFDVIQTMVREKTDYEIRD
ncbi:MAG: phenylalanine--tRNA ligase subunit beta [Opitutaceae bacterium]|nr:phenylalanine--tRNA ligase subunit beta [Opitutaceae bacterium]